MSREKRRPTLDELKDLHPSVWYLEMAQIVVDAEAAGLEEIKQETLSVWMFQPLTPEKVVELREKLQRAIAAATEDAA
jgi:hypothetical protein